jgi:hypothetical protein
VEVAAVRVNRDTLYSLAIFDLAGAPITVTLPDPGQRFISLQVVNQDHYVVDVVYEPGAHTYTRDLAGTRYVFVALRTLLDPMDPADLQTAHAIQDSTTVSQEHPGTLELPSWDQTSQTKVREALVALGETLPDYRQAFGARDTVDPIRHLIATATAWGGNPDRDAVYLNVTPSRNDGTTAYMLKVPADVPVGGFWSVTVYDATGHLQRNDRDAYSYNSITAKRGADESITIHFGGWDETTDNCLPIMPGWNYMVRLYLPRAEILNDSWQFPDAAPEG